MTNLNLDGLQPTKESLRASDPNWKLALAAICLFIASATIALVSAALVDNYEGLGKATVYLSLAGFFGYRFLRGVGLNTGLAKLLSAVIVFGIVGYGFGFVGISSYVQRKRFENLTANVRAIAEKNKAESTQMGEKLAAGLEQCQVQDVYPMLGGRTEVTRANLADVQSRVDKALRLLTEYSSQSQFRLEQMKREALMRSRQDVAKSFIIGVDQGASKLREAFAVRREFYAGLDEILRFLALKYGTYRSNGEKLLFDREGDSAKFDAMLDRLHKARNVWEP
jgi:hypothetical protein